MAEVKQTTVERGIYPWVYCFWNCISVCDTVDDTYDLCHACEKYVDIGSEEGCRLGELHAKDLDAAWQPVRDKWREVMLG